VDDVDKVHRRRWRFGFERATSQPPVLQQLFIDREKDRLSSDDPIRIWRKGKSGGSKEKLKRVTGDGGEKTSVVE
jgi:hypothetical protein